MKRCPECRNVKKHDDFNKNRAQADGLATWCHQCEKDYRDSNKDKRSAQSRSWAERNQKCTEPGCDVLTYGTGHTRCDPHRTEIKAAREAAAQDRAARAELERQEKYAGRTCQECRADISHRGLIAKYCETCYTTVNKRHQHAAQAAARKVIERACADCQADITERATQRPLATRCESCQEKHRSSRPRARKKSRAVERSCSGCGMSLKGHAKGKTICGYCERGPRWCIGCGQVDVRGQHGLRCEGCQVTWDTGASERVRQWQAANPEKTMLIRARARAKKGGLECTITLDDVLAAWPEDSRCPVYGVELVRNLGQSHASPESPSLDRIDNSKGYVPGNVHVISLRANGTKQDLSIAELVDGRATPEWQEWARSYLARKSRRRAVRRQAA